MKKLALLVATILTACGGDAGPQGPIGPTGPTGPTGPAGTYARGDFYCVGLNGAPSLDPIPTQRWGFTVSCLHVLDLPVTGSCANGVSGLPRPQPTAGSIWLAIDQASNWSDPTKLASWTCEWDADLGSGLPSLQNTLGQMCCIAH